jgi:hypothetical protein
MNIYLQYIEEKFKIWKIILKTNEFPSAFFIKQLEKNNLIFSFRHWYYIILVDWRSKIDTLKFYFYDILKKVLDEKYWINWYISDKTAEKIRNKNLEDFPKQIEIRTKNGKSMNFLLINFGNFKINIFVRTDKNIWKEIYDEFRGMRIKYILSTEGFNSLWNNNVETSIYGVSKKDVSNNNFEKINILKIIINEQNCDLEDLSYLSELEELKIKNILKELLRENKIYFKNNKYSIFKDFVLNIELFKNIENYFIWEKRKKLKNIYIIWENNIYFNEIYNHKYDLWEFINNEFLEEVIYKYKNIKNNESFLKKEKLDMIFKSAELEGFGWTYADTKKLIEENIKPLWMSNKDKNILVNIKDAFDYIIKTDWKINIIEVNNLIQRNLTQTEKIWIRRKWIDVKISNSIYFPMKWKDVFEWWFEKFNSMQLEKDSINSAFKILMIVSFLQIFYDWNKRTARIISNAILYKNNLPFINFSSVEKLNYDKSMVYFYETWDYEIFKKYFIQSFMQWVIRVLEYK